VKTNKTRLKKDRQNYVWWQYTKQSNCLYILFSYNRQYIIKYEKSILLVICIVARLPYV